METVAQILNEYHVDFERGFLPPQDPLLRLPAPFEAWESLADNFTPYINAGVIREQIDALPLLEDFELDTAPALERAMLLLSFFAHAYIHLPPNSVNHLPAAISVPWLKIAHALQRKPILSHASIVLNNWRRLDRNKPIQLDNLVTLFQFHGGLDENWFYLVTVEIERVGAPAIPLILEAMKSVEEANFPKTAHCLQQAQEILGGLNDALKKMYTKCDPHVFYLRVRPFLASFENIEYVGSSLKLQNHHGGSAAQSSLLQFFDAAFGIEYQNQSAQQYLRLMREHMPQKHAAFLTYVEQTSKLREAAAQNKALEAAYKACINSLIDFRNEHLKMVALYVMKPAKDAQSTAKGTGGTNPMVFLKTVRNQNDEVLQDLSKEKN